LGIYEYMQALSERMRRVRVCCGDWRRVLGPSVTTYHGVTAVFLDPPYSYEAGRDMTIYGDHDDGDVAHAVRQWALDNGHNPLLKIALCGYDAEHEAHMPPDWTVLKWKAPGGYGLAEKGRKNSRRERIWFSPSCGVESHDESHDESLLL
jgi:site-specific DNA-adenine methylase